MTTQVGNKVVKNASVLFASQIVTWGLTLLLTIVQPRLLGAAGVGELAIAVAMWGLGSVLIGFGMDTLLTKRIARNAMNVTELYATSIWMRIFFYLIVACIITVYMFLADFEPLSMVIVHIVGLSALIWQLINATQAVLQALEVMHYISVANIVAKAITTFFGIGVLVLGFGLLGFGFVLVLAALSSFLIQFYYLRRNTEVSLALKIDQMVPVARDSMPYVMTAFVTAAFANSNTLILGTMMTSEQVGWFGSASLLFGTFLFVPVVFSTAIFPMLARTFANDPNALPAMLRKSVEVIMLIGAPIGFGLMAIAQPLIVLLFGQEFAPAGPVLQIMGVALFLMYINVLLGQFYTSTDRQNTWTACLTTSTVTMIVATILLVPLTNRVFGNGAIGAAAGVLIAELCTAVLGLALLPRGVFSWSTGWAGIRTVAAGCVMAGVAWMLRDAFIAVPIGAGALVYVLLLALLRLVPTEDLQLLRDMAQGLTGRVLNRRAAATQ